MIRHNLAYRHLNDEVEGFTGYGFTTSGAKDACLRQITRKLDALGHQIDPARVIHKADQVAPSVMLIVRSDWATYDGPGSSHPMW